jgi:hypothetical protein
LEYLNLGRKNSAEAYAAKEKTKQLSKIIKADVPGAVPFTDKVASTFHDAKIRARSAKLVSRASTTSREIRKASRATIPPHPVVSRRKVLDSNRREDIKKARPARRRIKSKSG